MKNSSPVVVSGKFASDLKLPLFAAGQMLRHDDLAALADYTRDLTRLMLRSLFGCGVVCGLCVDVTIECGKLTVKVDPGVAIDCNGDLIHVPKTTTLAVDPKCEAYPLPRCLWVVLRGVRKCCAPRPVACSGDDDEVASTPTREQYWYELQVCRELPECVCRCSLPGSAKAKAHDQSALASGHAAKDADPCAGLEPEVDCYKNHKEGKCDCACADCTSCQCEWIMLARLELGKDDKWYPRNRVRRFVRPELMHDPGCDEYEKKTSTGGGGQGGGGQKDQEHDDTQEATQESKSKRGRSRQETRGIRTGTLAEMEEDGGEG